jgi:hypothetical protein
MKLKGKQREVEVFGVADGSAEVRPPEAPAD